MIIILILFAINSFAQIQWSTEKAIRQGENIEWYRSSAEMTDGSVVYVWSDTRFGDRDVWAQRMDDNGNKMWSDVATLVNGEINRQEDPVVIRSSDNGLIIAWVDFRYEDSGDVFIQKLNENGELLWAEEGVQLCTAENIQISLNIVPDDDGGAYVIWIDNRNTGGSDIYGTHVDADGNIVAGWDVDGKAIVNAAGEQNQHTFWQDGEGGAIALWHDTRDANNENIYMQRIAADGSMLWGENGTILVDAANTQEKPKITPDGTGNFIVAWRDKRDDGFGDIYAQRIDLDGNLLWSPEISVYSGDGVQKNPRVTEDSEGGAFIVWEDGRNEIAQEYKDLYMQKLATDGSKIWQNDGLPVALELNDQINPRLKGDDEGGVWLVWEDCRFENHPYGDIFTQHFDSSGNPLFAENGEIVCSISGFQFSPVVRISNSKIFFMWGDNRTGSTALYYQVMTENGNVQLTADGELIFYGLSGNALNHSMLPNDDEQIILWRDTRDSNAGIQIYMQVLNSDGSFGLIEDGEPITVSSGYDQENYEALITDDGIIAACWEENREGFKQIFAQAVDTENNYLWSSASGIQVGESYAQQEKCNISFRNNNGTNEFYIGWEDFTDFMDSRISAQKIVNGNLAWDDAGVVIADRIGNDELTDVTENYFIWQSVGYNNENIFCKLVDENGNTAAGWPDEGLEVCMADGRQENGKGIILPEGILVIWDDFRNGDLDIYGQLISPDGNILWDTDGIPLLAHTNDQNINNFLFMEDNGFFMIWEDFRSGSHYDVYMQKYNEDGVQLWMTDGVEVAADTTYDQVSPYFTSNGTEFMVFWEDYQNEDQSNLYAQYLDSSGNLMWPEQGFLVNNAIRNQNQPIANSYGDHSYVIWQDTRSSGKTDIYNVYAQKLNYEPVFSEDNVIQPEKNALLQNYPNPFNPTTTIKFSLQDRDLEALKLEIYNIKGQLVKKFAITSEQNSVLWNGKDNYDRSVGSGIYFYRLKAKEFESETRKMILMK